MKPSGTQVAGVAAVLAGLIGGGIVVFLLFSGGSDPSCERVAQIRVTEQPISEERFALAFEGVEETRGLTEEARGAPPEQRAELLEEGFETFFEKSHNLTHDFDRELCEIDFGLAEDVREGVLALEIDLQAQNNPDAILLGLDEVERLLNEAEAQLHAS